MRSTYLFLVLVMLIPVPALALPVEVTGTFTEVQPDAFQGQDQDRFFGPGAIQQSVSGALYLQAVGPDGQQHWQLIPLDWQWTMHAADFHLLLDAADFILTGIGVVNPFGATVVGPTDYVALSLADTELTVGYLGWPIAHGQINSAPVPEPSTLLLLGSGLAGLGGMVWRRNRRR